jgi:hypothetical protein
MSSLKPLISFGIIANLASSLFGQGQVFFNNISDSVSLHSPIYSGVVGGTLLSGSDFRAVLLGGTTDAIPAHIPSSRTNDPSPLVSGGTLLTLASDYTGATWVTFRTGLAAGFVAVGTDSMRDSQLPGGSTGQFQVAAWSGGYSSWNEAFIAWQEGTPGVLIGVSNPLILTVSLSPIDPVIPHLEGLESFAIVPAPEPSSRILSSVGLGVLGLLLGLRRRGHRARL